MSPLCAGLASVIERAERIAQPLAVSYCVTHRCDRACPLCYVKTNPPGPNAELDTAGAIAAVQAIARAGGLFLAITGGEPCLRQDLTRIIEAAREAGLAVELLTHGGQIDEALARALARLRLLAAHVTVFSADPAIHDRLCGCAGGLDATLRGLEQLRRAEVPTVLMTPLVRENFEGRGEVRALAGRLGAGFVADPTISPRDDGDRGPLAHRIDREQLARFIAEQPAPDILTEDGPLCAAGQRTLHVDPDGAIRPCIQDPRILGSLRETSIEEIWNNNETLREIRELRAADLTGACQGCEAVRICGRCGALALLEHGDGRGPWAWACQRAEALGYDIDHGQL